MSSGLLTLMFIVGFLIFILIGAIYGQYDGFEYAICSKCGSVMDEEKNDTEMVCWRCDGTKA